MFWKKVATVVALVPSIIATPLFILNNAAQDESVPSLTSRQLVGAKNPAGQDNYTVVSGDTGYIIAAAYSTTFDKLDAANPGVQWTALQIGQVLKNPSSRKPYTYRTAAGDTAASIASAYNIYTADLNNANPSVDFNNLAANTYLRVPGYGRSLYYTVYQGDTSNSIAQAFGVSSSSLAAANPGANFSTGSKLTIPVGASPSTGTVPTSSVSTPPSTTTTTTTTRPTTTTTTTTTTRPTTSTTTTRTSTITITTTTTTKTTTTTTTTRPTTTTTTTKTTTTTTTKTTSTSPTVSASVTGSNSYKSLNGDVGNPNNADRYVFYKGDGSASNGWPSQSQWITFNKQWERALPYLGQSCQGWGVANNSPSENSAIKSAILEIAFRAGVDQRYILATIVQESSGCVRAPTTYGSEVNPGLMQDYNGLATCNSGTRDKPANVKNPCPSATIRQMIVDGTMGTLTKSSSPDGGLVQNINRQNAFPFSQAYYRSSRLYNSGSIPMNNDLGGPGATRCYASDIANRLMGWVTAPRTCNLDG